MIVREDGKRLTLFRQPDHANLSGQLAAAWGAPPWEPAAPFPSVVLGARLHDEAWREWDEAPELTDGHGRPQSFFEVSRVTTAAMYTRGATAVEALDSYAGLMVSLHYSGFFHAHWDWQPFSTPEIFAEPERGALRALVDGELARQARIREALSWSDADETRLAATYKWLQLWDRISLDVCRQDPVQPWAVEYPEVPATAEPDGPTVSLKLSLVAPGRYVLNPYPLLRAPFTASLPAVHLDAGSASREAFLETWRTAPVESLPVSFEPAP